MSVLIVPESVIPWAPVLQALGDNGYTSYTATSGQQALELLARHPEISLVLIDAAIPPTGGYPLAALLRIAYPEHLKTILLSTFSLPAFHLALRFGFTDLVAKPYSAETVLAMVKKWG